VRDAVRATGRARAQGTAPFCLDRLPLVVPVVSGAGGVGRSVLTALLAAALSDHTTDPAGRAVAVCDVSPRAASPWPGWVDHAAQHGTATLAACAHERRALAEEMKLSTSALDRGADGPIWVLTDTGPLDPRFCGMQHAPLLWQPLLSYVRAAVIDADPLEASRLARQCAGGLVGIAAAWMTFPAAATTTVWVTDPSPAGLARTLEAITAAEQCRLPMEQFVVVVNDVRGHGWPPRARSRRTLLADRVGAIVDVGHNSALRDGARPRVTARDIASRDITRLVTAVLGAARPGRATRPAAVAPVVPTFPAFPPALAERTASHVAAAARPVPTLG
jgi:hypothetical protein